MAKLRAVARYVRSKAAGPFWITVDVFFSSREAFEAHRAAPALQTAAVEACLSLTPGSVRRIEVPDLAVIKYAYPRARPQGGVMERDMHGGQQFAPMLQLELADT